MRHENAKAFDDWLVDAIPDHSLGKLLNDKTHAPHPDRNHPYPAEHFLPLFVCLGAAGGVKPGDRLHRGFLYGVLSMAAFAWD